MKSEKQQFARQLLIARDCWDVPVRVRLRPYVEFIRRLDGQLQELVARRGRRTGPIRPPWRQQPR